MPGNDAFFRPLERFAARFADDVLSPLILPCEWMYMGTHVAKPRIHLYKHIDRRTYLNITARGRIAHYIPPPSFDDNNRGHYVISRLSVYADLERLDIRENAGRWERDHYCEKCLALLDRRHATRHLRAV